MKGIKASNLTKLITAVITVVVASTLTVKTVNAECQENYGGGETCFVTSKFTIEKFVKLEGDNSWKDEVLIDLDDDNENDKKILFKVVVTADIKNSANIDLDDVNFDDMKMKDKLPDELKFLDDESADDLTEEWDDFKPGESKTFFFTTKLQGDEKAREGEFEKCVVNKASLYYQDDFQGSDDAVVCYKKTGDVLGISTTELPETGFAPVFALAGLPMVLLGAYLKKTQKSKAA